MAWKQYRFEVQNGLSIKGDKTVAETRWWNKLWLLWFGWQKHAVLTNVSIYSVRVGYRDFRGVTMLNTEYTHDRKFRVRIGHEDCTFFGVNMDGKQMTLVLDDVFNKNDPEIKGIPLI